MFVYAGRIKRVVDGDTIDVLVDLGFRITIDGRCRLAGINAPETSTKAGKDARSWLNEWFTARPEFVIRTEKDRGDKYGRWLATIISHDGTVLNEAIVAAGHAVAWDGHGPRPT